MSPETADRKQAAHWSEFYDQVIAFEERILGEMVKHSRNMPETQRGLVDKTNIKPVRALIDDFKPRRDLWQQRERELKESTG